MRGCAYREPGQVLCLQRARTGLVPVLKSNRRLAGLYRPPKGPSSLELTDLTVNRQHRLTLREINQMEREMRRYTRSRSKGLVWQVPKPPIRMTSRWLLKGVSSGHEFRRKNRMSCSPSRLTRVHSFFPSLAVLAQPCELVKRHQQVL